MLHVIIPNVIMLSVVDVKEWNQIKYFKMMSNEDFWCQVILSTCHLVNLHFFNKGESSKLSAGILIGTREGDHKACIRTIFEEKHLRFNQDTKIENIPSVNILF